jgi:phosphatidylserine decarboxylase
MSTVAVVTAPDHADDQPAAASASVARTLADEARPATTTVPPVSRSDVRPPLTESRTVQVKGKRFVVTALDVRIGPFKDAAVVGEVTKGRTVAVTGRRDGRYAEVVYQGARRWVRVDYLSKDKPKPKPKVEPISTTPCATGSDVEQGLQQNTIDVHRAVCARYPQIEVYGGIRGDGMHSQGRALDIMVSSDLGSEIAAWLQDHAAELGVTELIWRQRIWTTERAGDGWRSMEDRGSPTANHMDHVHVTTGG